ncbi:hypothetical protein VHEMI03541 [[Torrubiella] hemipterigena]|uniref:NOT2/NOT3/NOT5 C-terminal domain-containing protein n=1 Tax=[Torrubiella] hemipterigena TaxID=1531966 RepID=A0A0A1SST6_9HYPO|nr:hypothetical protein VHEMI03541 [[Torrubiella] hemipterigena]
MNRPGAAPQTMRGMPGGFGGQQQPLQSNRSASNRLPNGKMAVNNNGGWALAGAAPMGGASFQNQSRQAGSNVSFAQSLGGSQSVAPLDPSEFPSLSNNPQLGNAQSASMWASGAARNVSAPIQRNQATTGSLQHPNHDDVFHSSSSRAGQGSFRFGSHGAATPSVQQQTTAVEEFPPLNRTANGESGVDRTANLMSSLGISSLGQGSIGAQNRGNGLLNAVSANSRASEPRSPPGVGSSSRRQGEHEGQGDTDGGDLDRHRHFAEELANKHAMAEDSEFDQRFPASDPKEATNGKQKQADDVVDPLEGMAEIDRWGIKGLRTLMNNYPDYHAMVVGMDPTSLGLDMSSPELISTQIYSLFDETLPRPTVHGSNFRLPECYNVTNVQPIESKIVSFNEETLFWIFYSCPGDAKQQMAAIELYSRNWRWHRKLQLWLTKDDMLTPQPLGPSHERGFYIVWDASNWRKDRREITLNYSELDTSNQPQGAV